jgi:hypothetical protein
MAAIAAAGFLIALAGACAVPPTAAAQPTSCRAVASAQGQSIGAESDVRPTLHGDLLDGVCTIIDAPGAELATIPSGLNNRGQMVGANVDVGGTTGSPASKPSGNACGAYLIPRLRGFWCKHIARNGLPSRFPRVMGNA